jgi:hypothetical protein
MTEINRPANFVPGAATNQSNDEADFGLIQSQFGGFSDARVRVSRNLHY